MTSTAVAAQPNPTGWAPNTPTLPDRIVDTPDLHLFGAFSTVGVLTALLLIFTLVLADFFDVMGTTVALATEADLLDEDGILPNTGQVLFVDGLAAVAGHAHAAGTSYPRHLQQRHTHASSRVVTVATVLRGTNPASPCSHHTTATVTAPTSSASTAWTLGSSHGRHGRIT